METPARQPTSSPLPQHSSNIKVVVIAVVVTALVTSLIAGIIFFCYRRKRKIPEKKEESSFNPHHANPLLINGNHPNFWKRQGGLGTSAVTGQDIAPGWPAIPSKDQAPLSFKGEFHQELGTLPDGKEGDSSSISGAGSQAHALQKPLKGPSVLAVHPLQGQYGDKEELSMSMIKPDASSSDLLPGAPLYKLDTSFSDRWPEMSPPPPPSSGTQIMPALGITTGDAVANGAVSRQSSVGDSGSRFYSSWSSFDDLLQEEGFNAAELPLTEHDDFVPSQDSTKVPRLLYSSSSTPPCFPVATTTAEQPVTKQSTPAKGQTILSSLISTKIAQLQQPCSNLQPDETHSPAAGDTFIPQLHVASKRQGITPPAAFSFTTQPVPPLPLPPALVSAAILKAQQQTPSIAIVPSVPVKTVAAAFSSQAAYVSAESPLSTLATPNMEVPAPRLLENAEGPSAPPPPPLKVAPPLPPDPPAPPLKGPPPLPPGPPAPPKGPPAPPTAPPGAPPGAAPLPPQSTNPSQGEASKLKPLHWDKVRADSSHSMVWDRLKTGSFQLDEDEIATLFAKNAPTKRPGKSSLPPKPKGFLESKKAHHIAIQLRALKVPAQEICDSLLEGEGLSAELLDILVKMCPTQEEQKGLLDFHGNKEELGPADKFLKTILEIPNAFQRLEAMRFKACFKEDLVQIRESLETLEAACRQLRESRLLLKLLEAVLKTGNHMNKGTNRGEAAAFKLDTLLKLADVKSADNKTTLLHFVVEEIIKAEGLRAFRGANLEAAGSSMNVLENEPSPQTQKNDDELKRKGLEVVLGLCTELDIVKKAADMDVDALNQSMLRLVNGLSSIEGRLKTSFQIRSPTAEVFFETEDSFAQTMEEFCSQAEGKVKHSKEELDRVFDKVKQVTSYFHGNVKEAQPLRLFMIVRDFLYMLEVVCKDLAKPLKLNIRG